MGGQEIDSMEKRTQLSIILLNTPGELAKLCEILSIANINILAMNIQNAKDAVNELFKIREKTRRRIALAESYRGILKDSSDYSIIRVLVDRPEDARERLNELGYLLDSEPVLIFTLVNKPGMLGQVATKLGEAGINIEYTYGSVKEDAEESIFILHVSDIGYLHIAPVQTCSKAKGLHIEALLPDCPRGESGSAPIRRGEVKGSPEEDISGFLKRGLRVEKLLQDGTKSPF